MPTKSKPHESNASYRELSTRLEDILNQLQASDLDIEQATELYEEGLKITVQLEAYLQQAENKIQSIRTQFSDTKAA